MSNILTKKFTYHQTIEFVLIFFLLIFPKIDLIDIPNYHQGIRIEDLAIIYIGISLYFSNSIEISKKDFGYFFYIFFFILLVSIIHGSLYFSQHWVIIPRYLEYILLLIYFNRHNPSPNTIFFILRLYLILNFIFVILQQNDLFGEFSSLGYESPANKSDHRPNGLTGGPWELSNCSAIIFFALLLDKNQSNYNKYFYSLIAIFLILATNSRTILIAFVIALTLYSYIKYIDKRKFYLFILLLFFAIIIFILYIQNFLLSRHDVYLELISMFKNFLFYQEKTDLSNLDGRLWSVALRIEHWLMLYKQFLHNPFTIVFGSGATSIYYESTLFRVLFGSGIIGLIFVIYSIKKIPLHILALFLISGLALDLLLSFKIFFTMLLYFYINKKINYDYRN